MPHFLPRTLIAASVLAACNTLAFSAELNPTLSDEHENTRGGTGALLNQTGTANTAFGRLALNNTTTGADNAAIGYTALYYNTTGNNNIAIGSAALYSNTEGNFNTAMSPSALYSNTTGNNNIASGYAALYYNTTGNGNVASGVGALNRNTTGAGNVASGYQALLSNTTGNYNTGIGYKALFANTGAQNTALGVNALRQNTIGSNNIAIGVNAGLNLITGANNIYLGHIGASEFNTTRIGTSQTRTFVAGVYNATVVGAPVYVSSTGQLGRVSSSARFKQDISTLGTTSEALYQLRPVSFHYKQDPNGTLQYGLIAEEVAAVYPDLVTRDADGQIDGMRYDALIPLLLNELQSQHQKDIAQADRIQAQVEQLAELKEENQRLQAALAAQDKKFQTHYARLASAVEQLQSQARSPVPVIASALPQSFGQTSIAAH